MQYHAKINQAIHLKEAADGERILRERLDEALRLRPIGLQRNPCTNLIEPYDGAFDPTRPLPDASPPKVSLADPIRRGDGLRARSR
eukprot:1785784-Pleurochrysis_carterae.AAC.1